MKKLNAILATLVLLGLPLTAAAMEGHGEHGKSESMKHGAMDKMEHGSMHGMEQGEHGKMMEGMEMVGAQTAEGVKAMAHLKDVQAAMAKMGMKETHHFMVMFMDTATGKSITEGTVAVKIKDPAGNISGPIMLMGMQGHFGADITLPEEGTYEFQVGTKLPDGQKRQYEFKHTVE